MVEEPAVAEEGTPPPEAAPPPTTAASNADIGSSAGGSAALESQADDVGTSELEMQEEGGAKSSSEEEDDEEGGDTLGELAGVRSPRTQAELEKSSAQPAAAPAPLSDEEQARRRMSITSQSMADQAAAMAAAVAAHGAVETKPVNKDAVRCPNALMSRRAFWPTAAHAAAGAVDGVAQCDPGDYGEHHLHPRLQAGGGRPQHHHRHGYSHCHFL